MDKIGLEELKIEKKILEIYFKCHKKTHKINKDTKTIIKKEGNKELDFNPQELERYREEITKLMNQLKNEQQNILSLYTNMLISLANALENLDTLNFRKKVLKIYSDCLCPFEKQWKPIYNSTLGTGKINDYIYNSIVLKKYKLEIINLLSQLSLSKENPKFQELKRLKNGQLWTEFNLHAEILFSLANAINLMEFKQEQINWDKKERQNPRIKVKMKTK